MCGAADATPGALRGHGLPSREPPLIWGASIPEHWQLMKNWNEVWAQRSSPRSPHSWRLAPRPAEPCSWFYGVTGQRKKKQCPVSPGGWGSTGEHCPRLVAPHSADTEVVSLWTGPSGSQDTVPSVRPRPGLAGTVPGLPPKSGCDSATALLAHPCSEGPGTSPEHGTFTSPHPHVPSTRDTDTPTGALGFLVKPGLSPPRRSRVMDGEKQMLVMRKEGC